MNSDTSATVPDGPPGRGSGVGEERFDAASQARGTASKPGPGAADKPAGNREASAEGSQDEGPSPPHAEPLAGGPRVGRAARAAADSLDHTAKYIREHDVAGMMTDVKRLVKDNPVPALIGAAILGFLLARTLSRD